MISEQRVISEGRELINQRIFKLDSFYQLNITFAIDGCSRAVLSSALCMSGSGLGVIAKLFLYIRTHFDGEWFMDVFRFYVFPLIPR